ncbi:cobalt transporter [Neosynechococcus sphagnicola sy1]|uniref:Cobalt transporter n=1 Tax=Neosynechococcus sphagnicola sy1 TaxID=1497020 RepID=A0A098TNU4_9CYAN|nr:cation diffusion facilitator family transporter [Neosynechococcus sphagnicola]KGF72503.1 cobalt transporter [Neosynechococcus sphagnicola sy1]
MSHSHGSHDHGTANYNRAFIIGITLNLALVVFQAISGVLAHSLALLTDAGHNLSDVLGLLLAWGANLLASRPPTQRFTYGLRRTSILAALANAIFLLVAVGAIAWEALQRFHEPAQVSGGVVIGVAIVGILVNTGTALLFLSGRKQDLNIRGAFLHLASDAIVSLGVVLAGIVIVVTGWNWIDPVVSLVISGVIIFGTWELLLDSVKLALDAVPEGLEPLAVRTYLTELPGVTQIHDLHIWGMSTSETALTVHLVIPGNHPGDDFLCRVSKELHDQFGIEHATIQVEQGDPNHPCGLEAEDKV